MKYGKVKHNERLEEIASGIDDEHLVANAADFYISSQDYEELALEHLVAMAMNFGQKNPGVPIQAFNVGCSDEYYVFFSGTEAEVETKLREMLGEDQEEEE